MKNQILLLSTLFLITCSNLFSQSWASIGTGIQNTTADYTNIYTMLEFNNELYIGGCFTGINGVPANYIAKFDGTTWSALGNGLWHTSNTAIAYTGIRTMTVFNGELYVGGTINQSGTTPINGVAKWNGTTWIDVGGFYAFGDRVLSLTVYNNELYAAGIFSAAYNGIAKWNGVAWIPLGAGIKLSNGMPGLVRDMIVYNNTLYIGGQFATGDGISSQNLIAWNGANFVSIGTGATGVYGIAKMGIYNNDLVVDGGFTDINGTPLNNIGRFDNVSWSAFGAGTGVPGGTSFESQSILEYNNKMFVGGSISTAGSTSVNNIAQWDGISWQTVGSGTNGYVGSLTIFQNELYAGGTFTTAGGISATNIAKWTEVGAGVNENNADNSIVVYPNPFSVQATLQISVPLTNATLTVLNQLGQTVTQIKNINGNSVTLSRSNLSNGQYFVRLTEENKTVAIEKLVVTDK